MPYPPSADQPHLAADRAAAMAAIGTTLLGKWRLEQVLGVGGMGAVFAATHRNGMRGAVKLLHARKAQAESETPRFLREGYIANKVDHPGVVRVLDDDVNDDGRPFLVMDLLAGKALYERAQELGGTLEIPEVLEDTHRLLDVLAAAHTRDIVHRDIKPDNVFLTNDGMLKVLDFGIARLFEPARKGVVTTQSGLILGTPAYMSPEQACGKWSLVDGQSDIWSVGATMFELLTGQSVHVEESVLEILAMKVAKPARSLASVMPNVPSALVELVDRALERQKACRWLDDRSMQSVLENVYQDICGIPISCSSSGARDVPSVLAASALQRPAPRDLPREVHDPPPLHRVSPSPLFRDTSRFVESPPSSPSAPVRLPPVTRRRSHAAKGAGLDVPFLFAIGGAVCLAAMVFALRADGSAHAVAASLPASPPPSSAPPVPPEPAPPSAVAAANPQEAPSLQPTTSRARPPRFKPRAAPSAFDTRLFDLRH